MLEEEKIFCKTLNIKKKNLFVKKYVFKHVKNKVIN